MTEQTETQPLPPGTAPAEAGVVRVQARRSSRLEQLHALYFDLQAEKKDVEARFKAVTDAIKLEVSQTNPEARKFELHPPKGSGIAALRVTYSESQRFDSTRFKKEHPDVYVGFLKTSHAWTIRPAADGGGE